MNRGLKRVALWACGSAALFAALASAGYWILGIPPTFPVSQGTEAGLKDFTITGYFVFGFIISLLVALYCAVHMNDDDTPGYN